MYDISSAFGGYSGEMHGSFAFKHWVAFSVHNFYLGYDNAVYLEPAFRLFIPRDYCNALIDSVNCSREEYYETKRNLVDRA